MGKQWPDAVLSQREREGRPCLTINRLPAFARQIVNDARQNKPAIKVKPADSGADVKTAEIYNGLIRNIEVSSNAEIAYDTALNARMAASATGASRRITRTTTRSDLDLCIERVANPFTVYGESRGRRQRTQATGGGVRHRTAEPTSLRPSTARRQDDRLERGQGRARPALAGRGQDPRRRALECATR